MMAEGHEVGFGYLRNVAVDQHLLTRHREEDLVPVIKAHSELLGIGLDEPTAIVVKGDQFEVIGRSKVAIYDGQDHDGKKYYFLDIGDRFDLKARKRIERRE
jgi:cyanophycinase